jgi:hypothetical protein
MRPFLVVRVSWPCKPSKRPIGSVGDKAMAAFGLACMRVNGPSWPGCLPLFFFAFLSFPLPTRWALFGPIKLARIDIFLWTIFSSIYFF